jgi:hypothetical protein
VVRKLERTTASKDRLEDNSARGGAMSDDPDARSIRARSRRATAAELLVAGEISMAGTLAVLAPRNWPGFDVVALPDDQPRQRIQVKSCLFTSRSGQFIGWSAADDFDWLAVVLFPAETCAQRHI